MRRTKNEEALFIYNLNARIGIFFFLLLVMVFGIILNCPRQANADQISIGSGFSSPKGIALDSSGNIYIADSGNGTDGNLYKIDVNNVITTLCSGSFNAVAVDSKGNVYAADSNRRIVDKISPEGSTTQVAQTINQPCGLAVDASDNIYITDVSNGIIYKMDAGNGSIQALNSADSNFSCPYGVTVDKDGNVYVADNYNNGTVYILSNGQKTALNSSFSVSQGIAVDSSGDIYIADWGSGDIFKMDADGNNLTPLASNINQPFCVAVDRIGSIYYGAAGGVYKIQKTVHFSVDAPGNALVGNNTEFTVTARDDDNNTITGYETGYSSP